MAMQMQTGNDDESKQCYEVACESLKNSRKLFGFFPVSVCAPKHEHEYLNESINECGGAYDVVFKFQDNVTGTIKSVGVKKCRLAAEIDIFKSLRRPHCHPSIVPFSVEKAHGAVFVVAADHDHDRDCVVADLRSYVAAFTDAGANYSNEIKKWMKQLVQGVHFLHGKLGIMHRDLNPATSIFITKAGDLKIWNFGMATRFGEEASKHPYPSEETRLWYRAPELLEGVKAHSSEVDMWSVGCIMAELVLDKVMFRGKDEKDQADVIVTFGSLGEEPQWSEEETDQSKSMAYAKYQLSDDGYDLLSRLLKIHPSERITAKAALDHAWFQD